jgi:hypothetical protein
MTKALDRSRVSRSADLDSATAMYGDMLLGKVAGDHSIAFPEQLERTRLDFSLASLHVIDRYLGQVRVQQDGLAGVTYLNTVVAVACYLGEVIRRGTPGGECHWLRVLSMGKDDTDTGINLGDFADIMLGCRGSDQPLRLTRVVARLVSTSGHESSAYEYAVVAIKRIWIAAAATPE